MAQPQQHHLARPQWLWLPGLLLTWYQWFEVDKCKTQWAGHKDFTGLYCMGSKGVLQVHMGTWVKGRHCGERVLAR